MSDVTIPEGIREQARWVYDRLGHGSTADEDTIARAMAVAVKTEQERCAKIAELDTDWTLFQRQSKRHALTGDEQNVFTGPDDDGTYPTAKNVFAYTTGISAGRAIAQAIRSSHE